MPADPGLLPFNGNRMRVVGNSNGVVAGGAVERRLGLVSVAGGDISWIPTVGNPSGVHFTADGSVLWAKGSANGKTQEIKIWRAGAARMLWKEDDERWFLPTGRDSKVIVSPDGTSVAFVSDRTDESHLRDAGGRHVRIASRWLRDRRSTWLSRVTYVGRRSPSCPMAISYGRLSSL